MKKWKWKCERQVREMDTNTNMNVSFHLDHRVELEAHALGGGAVVFTIGDEDHTITFFLSPFKMSAAQVDDFGLAMAEVGDKIRDLAEDRTIREIGEVRGEVA
jgi:hypothetical protein